MAASGLCGEDQWYPTATGTPQGGSVAPVLANLTLDGLERSVSAAFCGHQNAPTSEPGPSGPLCGWHAGTGVKQIG